MYLVSYKSKLILIVNNNNVRDETLEYLKDGFIKSAEKPLESLSPEQKAKLNRKGNELFNKGALDSAERIFITTGYYDGLTRVGDAYFMKNEKLKALKFYHLAQNKQKEALILDELANIIKILCED